MGRIAYVNGRYLAQASARVHIEDRGYQFADGVYEVCEIRQRAFVDLTWHLDRLERSLAELSIRMPTTRASLVLILRQVVRRNRIENGFFYLQISRGVSRRDHGFPDPAVKPSLVVTAKARQPDMAERIAQEGISVVTVADERWRRVDIKSVSLLPNVLAKQHAREAGADEAWLVDEVGLVTEGSSTNAWIVTAEETLVTRPAEAGILHGITRKTLIKVANQMGIQVEERAFSVCEALHAREAFATSASSLVLPIVRIDESSIGGGKPGRMAQNLRLLLHSHAEIIPV